jgi:hypothetical protein
VLTESSTRLVRCVSNSLPVQVVLCASVLSKSGRILLARAFTAMPRHRLEGYLQSFPKLLGAGADASSASHTFVETDSLRYVYQPMESLYVLLLTTKHSNIVDDLECLRALAKLLPEYCGSTSEAAVCQRVFELTFAVDELVTPGGVREHVTLQQIKTFTEMDSHEEKLQKIITDSKVSQARDEARRKASDIDHQKAQARQAAAMAGNANKYNSYGSESTPRQETYSQRSDYDRQQAEAASPPEPSPSKSKPIAAAAPGKGKVKGMQLSKAKQTDDFFAQLNKEEKLAPPTGRPAAAGAGAAAASSSAAAAAAPTPKESVRVLVDEKVVCVLDREGGVKRVEIKGEVKLSIFDPDDAKVQVRTSGTLQESDGFKCRLHPKINKNLWASNGVLGLADATKGFPVGSDNAPIILKWRKESSSDADVPLQLNFWPNVEHGRSVVSVEYNAENARVDLNDVVVQIPCPSQQAPEIGSVEGEAKFDQKAKSVRGESRRGQRCKC